MQVTILVDCPDLIKYFEKGHTQKFNSLHSLEGIRAKLDKKVKTVVVWNVTDLESFAHLSTLQRWRIKVDRIETTVKPHFILTTTRADLNKVDLSRYKKVKIITYV